MNSCRALNHPPNVLLAEDDPDLRELLSFCFYQNGYSVTNCADGLSLLEQLQESLEGTRETIDLVVTDIRMPGLTGLEVLESFFDQPGLPPVICMTAFGDSETHRLAEHFHAAFILDKPFDIDLLLERARALCPPSQPTPRSMS